MYTVYTYEAQTVTTGRAGRLTIENHHIKSVRAADLCADQGTAQGTDIKRPDSGRKHLTVHQAAGEGSRSQCDHHHTRLQ